MEDGKIDDILASVLRMTDEEVEQHYSEIAPEADLIVGLTKIAEQMSNSAKSTPQGQSLISFVEQGRLFGDSRTGTVREDHYVLLIGDEQPELESRQRQFATFDIRTVTASTAVEGLARLEAEDFDAAVLECKPNTAEEIDACAQILRHLSRLPIVSLVGDLVVTDRAALDRDVVRAVARLLGEDVPKRLPMKGPAREESGRLFEGGRFNSARSKS